MTCPTARVLSDDGCRFFTISILLGSFRFSCVLLGSVGLSWVYLWFSCVLYWLLLGQQPRPVVGDILGSLGFSGVLVGFSWVVLGSRVFSWLLSDQNPTPFVGDILASLGFSGVLAGVSWDIFCSLGSSWVLMGSPGSNPDTSDETGQEIP